MLIGATPLAIELTFDELTAELRTIVKSLPAPREHGSSS